MPFWKRKKMDEDKKEAAAAEENPAAEENANPENPQAGDSEQTDGAQPEEASAEESQAAEASQVDEASLWKDKYLRTMADFDNFRKRTARDREDLFKQAGADVVKDVIDTVDNLARALDGAKDKADDPFVKGVRMVYDSLVKTLAKHGATPLDSVGEPLDPNYHQAIAKVPDAKVPEDHIVTEVKRGWLLNGKLLRAALVVVSAGAPEAAQEGEAADGGENVAAPQTDGEKESDNG